ncbi:MAG: GNAT family N-acetyltransferase [Cystobacterineae bacterium]|nr:GNAT family N-acetyltransferase [Cystobacterineae bacterium]
MTTNQQDSAQGEAAAPPFAEGGNGGVQVLKFGLPTEEELPMLAQLYAVHVTTKATSPMEAAFEETQAREMLEKFMRLRERIQVARVDGHVLGFVTIEPDGPVRRAAYLRHLVVKPECRRQGVGTSLLKRAHHMALEMSRKSLILRVDPSNENLVAFVRKAGFMTVGALSSKKSGKLRLLMSCEL